MTMQQYMIIATHKHLDNLEKEGKPHTRQSKELDKIWIKQIREAQKKFENRQKEKEEEKEKEKIKPMTIEEKMKKDQEEMIKKIIENK